MKTIAMRSDGKDSPSCIVSRPPYTQFVCMIITRMSMYLERTSNKEGLRGEARIYLVRGNRTDFIGEMGLVGLGTGEIK